MAIIKTTFVGTSAAENAPEVLAWLQANATEYFDTIEADSNGDIFCKIGETTVLILGFNSSKTTISLLNGRSVSSAYSFYFKYAVKTSKGLYLRPSDRTYGGDIFISKSNVGSTAIMAQIQSTALDSSKHYHSADLEHSPSWLTLSGTLTVEQADATSLAPLVFNGGFYSPNLYVAPFSQFPRTETTFSIGISKYVSNGYVVLAD